MSFEIVDVKWGNTMLFASISDYEYWFGYLVDEICCDAGNVLFAYANLLTWWIVILSKVIIKQKLADTMK